MVAAGNFGNNFVNAFAGARNNTFETQFKNKFASPIMRNIWQSNFHNIKQGSMIVEQFNSAFRKARQRVDPTNAIPAAVILSTYKAALNPQIATQVYLKDPQNLVDAENYARNAEMALGLTASAKTAEVAAIEALTAQIAALQLS